MAATHAPGALPAARATMSLPTLTAMVVGGMVGAGVFTLPARFGVATGVLGSLIAWAIAGAGMLMLAFVFQNLAVRKPELDSGVFVYAKAGFGDYAGFGSAIGFWASAVAGNAFYLVFITATLGFFVEGLGDGDTLPAVVVASAAVWLFHLLVARGVRDAAIVNRVVTVFKVLPIVAFVVVLAVSADAGILAGNVFAYDDLGGLGEQIRNTMIITTFVFIGIEGASVYSRYARRREDVGRATVLGFVSVLSIFALVTLSAYAVLPRAEIAETRQPSMAGVMESVVGPWGATFISVGVVVSVLGAYLAWTLMAAEVVYHPARSGDLPRALARENAAGTPIAALCMTSAAAQALLVATLFVSDALDFMLDLCTSLALVPYLLAAGYAVKIAVTGEGYEGVAPGVRRRHAIVAGLAVGYTLFLFVAAGLIFLLLSTVILAPMTLLYVRARREQGLRLFTRREAVVCGVVVVGAVVGAVGLATGRIAL
ncbi:MAG: basic amino acid/polyamine antiporter [Actinomycetota bacterium]|nr:basic amino acid/polyamine antiporter [Actinomycetota bacterium]